MFYRPLALTCIVVAFLAAAADACRCRQPPPPKEALEQSAAVFLGKVTKIDAADNGIVVTFAVDSSWKGPNVKELKVSTAANSAACGFEFEMGKSYVVYCHEGEGRLSTNICTRTRAYDDKDKSEIEALGPARATSAEDETPESKPEKED